MGTELPLAKRLEGSVRAPKSLNCENGIVSALI
jgi:hypothetical protein